MKSLNGGLTEDSGLTDGLTVGSWPVSSGVNLSEVHGALRDRFRGALLGLSLAPVALRLGGKPTLKPVSVASGLNHSRLARAVPKLLRYHDSWERRRHWIFSAGAMPQARTADDDLIAQVQLLMLGDCLEMALQDSDTARLSDRFGKGFKDLAHFADRLKQYDLSAEQQQYSLETLADFSNGQPRAFAGAILSAWQYPESYGCSVQAAAEWGGMAPAIAGLIAGARGGQSAIPVLWQMGEALLWRSPISCLLSGPVYSGPVYSGLIYGEVNPQKSAYILHI
jgi:hypothetical protein